jgi:molybdate transport repressor ModE-like protein
MQDQGFDWGELRLILAIAREGGLTGAARRLGIDHSTVFRRLQAAEARLGTALFERLSGGRYVATAAGERVAASAERMEDEAHALARDLAGRDARLSGSLRVTASETLSYRLLTRHLAAFRKAHPGIALELVIENRLLSLARREADVALRALRPREGDLWGRKLADVAWTIYGAEQYLAANGPAASTADLSRHRIISWPAGASGINAADWLDANIPAECIAYRTASLVNQLVAAREGLGLAALPCYLGDPEPGLRRAIAEPIPELARELWIVTHSDLRRTARIAAFFETVGEGLAADRPLIEGHGGA